MSAGSSDCARRIRPDTGLRGTVLRLLGRYDDAIAEFGQALALKAGDAESWHGRALAYAAAGRREQALSDYAKAVALDPSIAEAYKARGMGLPGLRAA